MKKYILSTIALAAITVGCTKSSFVDVPEAQKTPIAFDTYTGKAPTTRATSHDDETALQAKNSSTDPAFHVKAFYGSELYMNEPVWYESNKWEYANTIYWPASGTLAFYAYGDSDNLTQPSTATAASTEFTYTVPSAVSAQDDLLVAVPIAEQACTTAVVLNFHHMLSRVGFKLTTTTASTTNLPINVTINNVTLIGTFYESGTIDITKKATDNKPYIELAEGATPSVTSYSLFDTPTSGSYSFVVESPGSDATTIFANTLNHADGSSTTHATDDSDRFMMLIPGGTVTKARVEYQLPGQTTSQTVEGTLENPITLGAGLAYEFIIHLSTDVMEFTGTVTGWGTAQEVTPTPVN